MRRKVAWLVLLLACSSAPPAEEQSTLASHAHPITGDPSDYDLLLRAMGNAHLILLGEATHGTHEFYRERARLTQRILTERGFTALALEADWIDAARVDRYVRGEGNDRNANEALGNFERFPRWMWRNREFAELVEWIREHNKTRDVKVGVYGLDLYGHEELKTATGTGFESQQINRILKNAKAYERAQYRGDVSSWNIRDKHMVETMDQLQRHLIATQGRDGLIVWAHNSHVGDARATSRARHGEWNMGQLVREHWRRGVSYIVGFTTHTGTVMAATNWDDEPEVKQLRPSLRGSHGALLHEVGLPSFFLLLNEVEARSVTTPRDQRAVGVIYRPHTEYESHYFSATLREQFDAVIHWDATKAVTPLD